MEAGAIGAGAPEPELRLRIPARAENLALVRQALVGVAEVYGIEAALLADIKIAVTEACANVVLHAYTGEGVLELEAGSDGVELLVVVRDFGCGMQPRASNADPSALGLGLPLIAALSDGYEIHGASAGGTAVRMRFALAADTDAAAAGAGPAEVPTGAAMAIPAGPLLESVLSRVVSLLAARANLSIDRLSDLVLVGDAVSARAGSYSVDNQVGITVDGGESGVEVRVGPLEADGGSRLLAHMELPGLGSLENLVDEVAVETGSATGEYLVFRQAPGAG